MMRLILLKNWLMVPSEVAWQDPTSVCLWGEAYGHPRFDDGTPVVTTPIVAIDPTKDAILTESGSVYILGAAHPEAVEKFPNIRAELFRQHDSTPFAIH